MRRVASSGCSAESRRGREQGPARSCRLSIPRARVARHAETVAGELDAPVDALRTDGGVVRLRSVDDADAAALHELVDRVSDRSIYLRFFSIDRRAAHRFVASVLATPRAARRAIVSLVAHEIVGLAGYAPLTDTSAEIAVLIDDEHHHLGIGTLLIEDLIALARGDGLTQFVAEVLSENHS